jgi:alpha-beta hydrolase superfamily lysophospholipase
MFETKIIFCHGLESGPNGAKTEALRAAGLSVVAPDGQGKNLGERLLAVLAEARSASGPCVLVGSSYGGAVALLAAKALEKERKAPRAVVLCAPALNLDEAPLHGDPPFIASPLTILHGRTDDVVPCDGSLAYAKRAEEAGYSVDLQLLGDDHRLTLSLRHLVSTVRRMSQR